MSNTTIGKTGWTLRTDDTHIHQPCKARYVYPYDGDLDPVSHSWMSALRWASAKMQYSSHPPVRRARFFFPPAAGADTIAWLASAGRAKSIESGAYCWDRATRRIDLPLSGTRASEADVDELVAYLREATGA